GEALSLALDYGINARRDKLEQLTRRVAGLLKRDLAIPANRQRHGILTSRAALHQREGLNARVSDAHAEPWYDAVKDLPALARRCRLERLGEPIGESPPCHIPIRDNTGTTDVPIA